MAADGTLLQGEVIEDPSTEEKDIEKFLAGFLQALLREQKARSAAEPRDAELEPSTRDGSPVMRNLVK